VRAGAVWRRDATRVFVTHIPSPLDYLKRNAKIEELKTTTGHAAGITTTCIIVVDDSVFCRIWPYLAGRLEAGPADWLGFFGT